MTPGGIQYRMDSVVAAVENLTRAEEGDNDFLVDAARKRLTETLDAWAMDRYPQLRGKSSGVRPLVYCRDCGRLREHAGKGRCFACRYQAKKREKAEALARVSRPCVVCGEVKPVRGYGKCDTCYRRDRRSQSKGAERRAA